MEIKDTYTIEKAIIFPSASLPRNWQFAFELNPLLFFPSPSTLRGNSVKRYQRWISVKDTSERPG